MARVASPRSPDGGILSGGEPAAFSSEKEVYNENGKEVPGADGLQTVRKEDGKEIAGADGLQTVRREGGLEIVGADGMQRGKEDSAKEVTGADGVEVIEESIPIVLPSQETGEAYRGPESSHSGSQPKAKDARRRFKWLWIALAAIVIIGIALGVGLGVGLKSSHNTVASGQRNNSTSSASFKGAIPETGIAIAGAYRPANLSTGAAIPSDSTSNFYMCFQHTSGEVRWMIRIWPNTWLGGSGDEVVARDAKMGTPLAMLIAGDKSRSIKEWHIFYINNDNRLRERTISNGTFLWTDGLINNLNIQVYDDSNVALTAYPYVGNVGNFTSTDRDGGMRVWIGTEADTIDQYASSVALSEWVFERTWTNVSGRAAPACWATKSWNIVYTMFVDLNNTITMYWRDDGSKSKSTASHPVNEWVPTSISIPNIDPTSGLAIGARSSHLYAKILGDDVIHDWKVTFAAENSTVTPDVPAEIYGDISIRGTHMAALSSHYTDGATLLMYQRPDGSIIEYSQTLPGGEWNATIVPIP